MNERERGRQTDMWERGRDRGRQRERDRETQRETLLKIASKEEDEVILLERHSFPAVLQVFVCS